MKARVHREPAYYVLGDAWPHDDFLGFPMADEVDLRYVLRGLLEAVGDGAEVILDYTDLVDGGYYGAD